MHLAVLSGDTVIVRSKEMPEKGKPLKERSLHIAGLSAPRMGSTAREDEVCGPGSAKYEGRAGAGADADILGICVLFPRILTDSSGRQGGRLQYYAFSSCERARRGESYPPLLIK